MSYKPQCVRRYDPTSTVLFLYGPFSVRPVRIIAVTVRQVAIQPRTKMKRRPCARSTCILPLRLRWQYQFLSRTLRRRSAELPRLFPRHVLHRQTVSFEMARVCLHQRLVLALRHRIFAQVIIPRQGYLVLRLSGPPLFSSAAEPIVNLPAGIRTSSSFSPPPNVQGQHPTLSAFSHPRTHTQILLLARPEEAPALSFDVARSQCWLCGRF